MTVSLYCIIILSQYSVMYNMCTIVRETDRERVREESGGLAEGWCQGVPGGLEERAAWGADSFIVIIHDVCVVRSPHDTCHTRSRAMKGGSGCWPRWTSGAWLRRLRPTRYTLRC